MAVGLAIVAIGFISFGGVGVTGGESEYLGTFFLPIVLFGFGFGLSFAPLTMAAMASAPENNAGIASGVNHTMARVGQVLIVGVLGGLAITWFSQLLMNDAYIRSLPAEAQSHLAAHAGALVETDIPAWLTAEERERVYQIVRQSFATTFSILMYIGAAACLLCAAIAVFTIDDRELKLKLGQGVLEDAGAIPAGARKPTRDGPPDTPLPESP